MNLDKLATLTKLEEGTGPMRSGNYMPYDDATGHEIPKGGTRKGDITICYGWNLSQRGLPEVVAKLLLSIGMEDAVHDILSHPLTEAAYLALNGDDVRQRVLARLCYAMGLGHTGGGAQPAEGLLSFKRMLAAIVRGDHDAAAAELQDSHWFRDEAGDEGPKLVGMLRTGLEPT